MQRHKNTPLAFAFRAERGHGGTGHDVITDDVAFLFQLKTQYGRRKKLADAPSTEKMVCLSQHAENLRIPLKTTSLLYCPLSPMSSVWLMTTKNVMG